MPPFPELLLASRACSLIVSVGLSVWLGYAQALIRESEPAVEGLLRVEDASDFTSKNLTGLSILLELAAHLDFGVVISTCKYLQCWHDLHHSSTHQDVCDALSIGVFTVKLGLNRDIMTAVFIISVEVSQERPRLFFKQCPFFGHTLLVDLK